MRRIRRWLGGMAVAIAASSTHASQVRVENLHLVAAERETTLTIQLNGPGLYRMFTLSDPDRLVLDIPAARLGASALPLPAGQGVVRQVRAANRPDGSVRILLDLNASAEPQGTMRRANGRTASQIVVSLATAPQRLQDPVPAVMSAATRAPVAELLQPASPDLGQALVSPQARPSQKARPSESPQVVAKTPPRADSIEVGRDIVIAIDAGHGGKDPGARGPRGVLEKDVTLRIARRLAEVIDQEPGMRAYLTRNRDEFLPLRTRMERARAARADLFVSIHADAVRNRSVRGASVYVLNEKGATDEAARRLAARENAADLIGGVTLKDKDRTLASVLLDLSQNASLSSSIEVGDSILAELGRVGTVRKPRVMQAPFMVLKSPDVPSVLIETAYISNPEEERQLDSHAFRERLAQAIFAGVRGYFYQNPPRGTLVAELSRKQFADALRHVTRSGESLSMIASRYNVSVREIRQANGLQSDRITVGQVLLIPGARDI